MRGVEGETYHQTRLDLSKRRATALGFFERVDLSTKRGSSDDQMEVNVEVAERQTGAFQIGAGFSSVESFIAQAQISQNNLFGRGQLLTLQAQLSGLRQLFLLQFEDPYFLDTNWTFGFQLFNQQRYYRDYTRPEGVTRYFYPLIGPLVLRLRGEAGLITSRDPQGVPIYERYFLGGIFDVRGFQLYSLSPQIRVPADQNPDAGLNVFRVGGN